jgi:hypothetical protein
MLGMLGQPAPARERKADQNQHDDYTTVGAETADAAGYIKFHE